ncbi:MAG: hypothetical protein ACRENH_09565 [Gemmatimonadaceae bacterium]
MKIGLRSEVRGLTVFGLLVLFGCMERQPLQLEPPVVKADGIVAYLIATPAAQPNEYIVRAVARHGVALEDAGSFVAALQWTSATVTFVADASEGGVVRVVAPSATTVRVAGASDQGIASGELFALRVRAPASEQVNRLRLEITDLNDRSGVSMRSALVVVPTVTWTVQR